MATRVHVTVPELLVGLRYHVGFGLEGSLVVAALRDASLGLVERVDLPPGGRLDEVTTARLLRGLSRCRPTSVVVAAYDRDAGASARPALTALVDAVNEVTTVDAAVTVADRCWRTEPGGRWRPLPDALDSPFVAEYVGRGVAPLADRHALRRVLDHVPDPAVTPFVPGRRMGEVGAGVAAWSRLIRGVPQEDDEIAALSALRRTGHRDAVLMALVPLRGRAGDAGGTWGRVGTVDAWESQVATRGALVRLARVAPPCVRSAALSVLAVWSWNAGDGALADVAADAALDHDADDVLSGLVKRLLRHDVPPPAR